jgi:ATP-binding cassette subfamily B multidrug efflux pump
MRSIRRLLPLLRPYRGRILAALACLLLLTGAYLVLPLILRWVIDQGLAAGESKALLLAALGILALGAFQAVLAFGQRYLSESVAHRISFDLRNRLFDHIQHLSFTFHDHSQTGQLISRCIEDVRSIQNFTGQGVLELAQVGLLMVGVVGMLLITDARLAAIALLPMVPLILTTTRFGMRVSGLFLAVDNALGELSARLQENVTGAQVVRAFARERYEIGRFEQANRALLRARLTVIGEWAKIMPTSHLLVVLGTILVLWFGGGMVLEGRISLGELVAFNSYLLLLANPAQQLAWLVNTAGEAAAGLQRTLEILDRVPEIRSPGGAFRLPAVRGCVEFRNVTFHYVGEGARALHEIDVQVEPKQVVALIGPTGSGKSSLVHLIPRFYDVASGAVLVDGHDVREVDLESLRARIGIVLQTSLLFSISIRDNIAYGRPDASLVEIEAAARAAQAHAFIQEMPEGYDTLVGERGITLSGGQRQRVAIARALLMDPPILILDDSTSSVDTETEQLIQLALTRLMEGRTTFVIAQRLSTVRRADMILVMDGGRIIERGTHTDLLEANGLYREIYDLQLRDQEHFAEELAAIAAGRAPQVTEMPGELSDDRDPWGPTFR